MKPAKLIEAPFSTFNRIPKQGFTRKNGSKALQIKRNMSKTEITKVMDENTQKEHRNRSYKRGQHPNSKKNLKLWQEGEESPNPNGKPKGAVDLKNRLLKMLEAEAPGDVKNAKAIAEFCKGISKVTNFDAVNARLLYSAIVLGESWAVKELYDRIAGKASQPVDVDLQVNDWRQMAQNYGINEKDVIREAKLLLAESDTDSSD